MVKKESTTCETCNCGSCCGGKCFGLILTAVGCIAAIVACIFACKAAWAAQKAYNLNVLSAGWEANLEKMNELYSSKAYVDYATNQTDSYVSSFMSAYGNADLEGDTDDTEIDDEVSDTNEEEAASPEDIKAVVEDMVANNPVRGDKNARFTIVEYTELHCPYCQMHAQNWTINSVIEQFSGEVNSVSRHFIIHGEDAQKLASAMECVAELKADIYHEVFEKAFEAYPVDMDTLISIATWLGTDESALKSCIDEGRYMQAVSEMMHQWNELFGINGTPGCVIIDRETGNFELVSGAQQADAFVAAINKLKNA